MEPACAATADRSTCRRNSIKHGAPLPPHHVPTTNWREERAQKGDSSSPQLHSAVQPCTHLLPGDQQHTVLFAMLQLPVHMVEHQQLAPAVLQQLHLVSHL